MDYTMLVKISILNVFDEISIQEAKVSSELWLKTKIPDAELVSFEKKGEEKDGNI